MGAARARGRGSARGRRRVAAARAARAVTQAHGDPHQPICAAVWRGECCLHYYKRIIDVIGGVEQLLFINKCGFDYRFDKFILS